MVWRVTCLIGYIDLALGVKEIRIDNVSHLFFN
jgi:hypothetical protein